MEGASDAKFSAASSLEATAACCSAAHAGPLAQRPPQRATTAVHEARTSGSRMAALAGWRGISSGPGATGLLVTVLGSGGRGDGQEEWGREKAGSGKQGPQGILGMPATRGRREGWEPGPALGSHTPQQTGQEPLALLMLELPPAFLGDLVSGDTLSHSPEPLSPTPRETWMPGTELSHDLGLSRATRHGWWGVQGAGTRPGTGRGAAPASGRT